MRPRSLVVVPESFNPVEKKAEREAAEGLGTGRRGAV